MPHNDLTIDFNDSSFDQSTADAQPVPGVNVDVVFEPTAFAVPENVPLEFKVNPAGIEPEVTEKVTVSPSSSEAVIEVKFDPALAVSFNVPKEVNEKNNTKRNTHQKPSNSIL